MGNKKRGFNELHPRLLHLLSLINNRQQPSSAKNVLIARPFNNKKRHVGKFSRGQTVARTKRGDSCGGLRVVRVRHYITFKVMSHAR